MFIKRENGRHASFSYNLGIRVFCELAGLAAEDPYFRDMRVVPTALVEKSDLQGIGNGCVGGDEYNSLQLRTPSKSLSPEWRCKGSKGLYARTI